MKPVLITFERFPEKIQGQILGITAASNDGFIVVIDSSRHPIRQRFAIGHELAHIYLGHFDNKNIEWKTAGDDPHKKAGNDRAMEKEANKNAWAYYRAYRDGKLKEARCWERK